MYGDSQVAAPSGPDEEEQEEGQQTTTVPKSICPGMKVGDEMVLKIVADHDQSWEVAYAPGKDQEEEGGGGQGYGGPPPDEGMGSMME